MGQRGAIGWLPQARLEALESRWLLSTIHFPSPFYVGPDLVSVTPGGKGVVFINDDGIHGAELWGSDGTAKGTALIKDINPGAAHAVPKPIYNHHRWDPPLMESVGSLTYFMADDGVDGPAIWRTNGTAEGTVMVRAMASWIYWSPRVGNHFYFVAAEAGGSNQMLWRADASGTVVPLFDLGPEGDEGYSIGEGGLAAIGDTVYFVRKRTGEPGELWGTNGTPGGTVRVPVPSDIVTYGLSALHAWGGHLYLMGDFYGDVYRLNPRTHALSVVKNFGQASTIVVRGSVGGRLIFTADVRVKYPDEYRMSLWSTDGTAAGTIKLWEQTVEESEGSGGMKFKQAGNLVYFATHSPRLADNRSTKLLKTDGTLAGTRLVKRFDYGSPLTDLTDVAGTLYFKQDRVWAGELWKSDGTARGTVAVATLPTVKVAASNGSAAFTSVVAGELVPGAGAGAGRVFFIGPDLYREYELWAFDSKSSKRKMRRLPSVPPPVSLSGGRLSVEGLFYDDTIEVAANARSGVVTVRWNNADPLVFRLADVRSVVVSGGAGDDRITLVGPAPNATLRGGDGADALTGGAGDDHLMGEGWRDRLAGGAGNDRLDGGEGDDQLIADDDAGGDVMSGGDGNDWVSYQERSKNLVITLDGRAGDGEAGEGDNVMADIESVYGGAGNDRIVGSAANDWINGWTGNDTVDGGGGRDILQGWDGRDLLVGGVGDDALHGGKHRDTLNAGDGNDNLWGDDEYPGAGEPAVDLLFGGGGFDRALFREQDKRDSIEKRIKG